MKSLALIIAVYATMGGGGNTFIIEHGMSNMYTLKPRTQGRPIKVFADERENWLIYTDLDKEVGKWWRLLSLLCTFIGQREFHHKSVECASIHIPASSQILISAAIICSDNNYWTAGFALTEVSLGSTNS